MNATAYGLTLLLLALVLAYFLPGLMRRQAARWDADESNRVHPDWKPVGFLRDEPGQWQRTGPGTIANAWTMTFAVNRPQAAVIITGV